MVNCFGYANQIKHVICNSCFSLRPEIITFNVTGTKNNRTLVSNAAKSQTSFLALYIYSQAEISRSA